MTDEDCVKVVALVLPSGEVLWFEAARGWEYGKAVLDKWKAEHPEFEGTPCNCGAVEITMPREKYIAIGAQCGPGRFEWP